MKIGLVADSQGDVDALEYACDLLLDEKGCDRIFFLGGSWNDLDALFQRKREARKVVAQEQARMPKDDLERYQKRFTRVPDRGSVAFREQTAPRVLPELVGDRIACLVHDKADLKREDIEAAVFLVHGASSEPAVVPIGPRFFITPGKLASGGSRSFAYLSWEATGIELVALGLDGRELKRVPLQVGTRRKMSAQ